MKMTKAYRAALAQMADALAQQKPGEVIFGFRQYEFVSNVGDAIERRHPDFHRAMYRALDEHFERRKQRGIEKRRETLAKRKALKEGHRNVDR